MMNTEENLFCIHRLFDRECCGGNCGGWTLSGLVQQYQVNENISQKTFSEIYDMVGHQNTLCFGLCRGPVSNQIRFSSFT